MNNCVLPLNSVFRLLLMSLTLGAFTVGVFAQSSDESQGWEEFADSRPFPTAHISVPQWRLTDGIQVRSAFRDVIAEARVSTVRVRTDGRDTALGGIVGENGLILTKASRLPGDITCILPDQRELKAEIVGVDRDYDLALLKVAAQGLPVLDLTSTSSPKVGAWLATVGTKRGPQAVGVLSVEPRKIGHRSGILGVRFEDYSQEPLIVEVFPDTAASEGGLKAQDLVLSINGATVSSRMEFIRRVREFSPGDRLSLLVQRSDEKLAMKVRLKGQPPWRMPTREEFQNQLGSKLSQRRAGFPKAFQHDTVLKPSDCGGPVVNLNGQVVGFNLARAGRTETYAVPTEVVVELIDELKTGSLESSSAR